MNTVAMITSRWNSTRLSGKALADIGGKPLLQHIIDNARASKLITEVVVATTIDSQPIIDYCKANQISYYAHPNDWDVLGRLCKAGELYKADVVVYLWGDCPLIQSGDIDFAVNTFLKEYSSYLSVSTKYGYMGVLWVSSLVALNDIVKNIHDREYIHEHLKKQDLAQRMGLGTVSKPLSVDTQEDLDKVKEIYALL